MTISYQKESVVCLSSTDWYPIPTRKQQVMSRLPREWEILYVEPPITLLSPLKDRSMAFKLFSFAQGLRRIQENLYAYTPPPVLPFGNINPIINKINQRWLAAFIRRQVKKLGWKEPLIWTYLPNTWDCIKGLPRRGVVYDCVDEHSEYKGLINKELVTSMERELICNSNLIFCTAPGLYQSKSVYNSNSHLVPNGVNFQLFNQAAGEDTPVAAEMKALEGPVIGFVGVIQEWIDLDLIGKVAEENPHWSVVLVGPVGAGVNVESLRKLSNIHFLGRKAPEELPSYIKAFDVCLNPFRKSRLTENVSPLKFYEYLATGKPIVSVDMPAVREFSDCIFIAKDEEDFVAKIKLALEEDDDSTRARRINRARDCSWDKKVEEMLAIIGQTLGKTFRERKLQDN